MLNFKTTMNEPNRRNPLQETSFRILPPVESNYSADILRCSNMGHILSHATQTLPLAAPQRHRCWHPQ